MCANPTKPSQSKELKSNQENTFSRVKTIGTPLKSRTIVDLLKTLSPNLLQLDKNHQVFLEISHFLFMSTKNDDLLMESIYGQTNMLFKLALVGQKEIIREFSIQNYKQLDDFFTAKKSRLKDHLLQKQLNNGNPESKFEMHDSNLN